MKYYSGEKYRIGEYIRRANINRILFEAKRKESESVNRDSELRKELQLHIQQLIKGQKSNLEILELLAKYEKYKKFTCYFEGYINNYRRKYMQDDKDWIERWYKEIGTNNG